MSDVKTQYIETLIKTTVEQSEAAVAQSDDEDITQWWIDFLELALNKAEKAQEEKNRSRDREDPPVFDETLTWDEAARELGLRRNLMLALLRHYGVLMEDTFTDSRTGQERTGARHNLPYPQYEDRGWFRVNHMWCSVDVEVTEKGLEGIKKRLKTALEILSEG